MVELSKGWLVWSLMVFIVKLRYSFGAVVPTSSAEHDTQHTQRMELYTGTPGEHTWWLYFQLHRGSECSFTIDDIDNDDAFPDYLFMNHHSDIFHIDGIRDGECQHDQRFISLLLHGHPDAMLIKERGQYYQFVSGFGNSSASIGEVFYTVPPYLPTSLNEQTSQIGEIRFFNNSDCLGEVQYMWPLSMYSTVDSDLYLDIDTGSEGDNYAWVVNGCHTATNNYPAVSLKLFYGDYGGLRPHFPNWKQETIFLEYDFHAESFDPWTCANHVPVHVRLSIAGSCIPGIDGTQTSIQYLCNMMTGYASAVLFNESSSCSMTDSPSEQFPSYRFCELTETLPLPTQFSVVYGDVLKSSTTFNETWSSFCMVPDHRQIGKPTAQPTRDPLAPTAAPTIRTTSLLKFHYSFTVTEIAQVNAPYLIQQQVTPNCNTTLIRRAFEKMVCRIVHLSPNVEEQVRIFYVEEEEVYDKDCICRDNGLVMIPGDNTTTSLSMRVTIEVSVNLVDFLSSLSLSTTPGDMSDASVQNITIDTIMGKLDNQLVATLYDHMTYYQVMDYLIMDHSSFFVQYPSCQDPELDFLSLVPPQTLGSLPTAAPTTNPVNSVHSTSHSKLTHIEILSLSITIAGLLFIPCVVCLVYQRKPSWLITQCGCNWDVNQANRGLDSVVPDPTAIMPTAQLSV